jgi:methionyl-tRNA formyltransferase
VTYAAKIDKREARIDWSRPAAELERHVRALNPAPGAVSALRGQDIKLWRAHAFDAHGTPGDVIAAGADGIDVACAEGALRITELQRAGGKRLPPADFLRGFPIAAGERFNPLQAAD